jgi:hypothetical protein
VIATLQERKINTFNLITTLKGAAGPVVEEEESE